MLRNSATADQGVASAFDLNRCIVFDVEAYPGRWLVGFAYAKGTGQLATKQVEDKDELAKLIRSFASRGKTLVGYNSRHYDVPMVRAFLGDLDWYALGQAIIADDRGYVDAFYRSRPPKFGVDHIDVSERLRRGKYPPSLKAVAAAMGRPVLEELPFDPTRELDDDQWAKVKAYNIVDLGHTQAVLERVAPDLESLVSLSNEIGQDLRSAPSPQVVERVFIDAYTRAHGHEPEPIEPPREVIYEPLPGVFRPKTTAAAEWYDRVVYQPLPVDRDGRTAKIRVPKQAFTIGNLTLVAGAGGLHSKDKRCVYYSDDQHELSLIDVASFYPTLISVKGIFPESLGDVGLDRYRGILAERLRLKAEAKAATDPAERRRLDVRAGGLKLVLNSTFGKLGDSFSVMVDLRAMVAVTISGQLMLIDLIERLQACGVEIIYANTDGLFVRYPRGSDGLDMAVSAWQQDTGMTLEREGLARLAITATNHYAYIDRVGKVKAKGSLNGEFPACTSASNCTVPNSLIIPRAITEALLKDVPPERTIRGCDDPRMFCRISQRSSKVLSAVMVDAETGQEAELPKISRWYLSKASKKRILHRLDEGRHTTPAQATGVELAMDLSDGRIPDDLDYGRYIAEARSVIQWMDGYYHLAPCLLDNHPLALQALELGLCPVPKWAGKAQMKASKAERPTFLWSWYGIKTVGTYTGPATGVLVVDVDDAARWSKGIGGKKMALLDGRSETLAGCLVSCHGDATPDAVRRGAARGKLIFRFRADPGHPLARMNVGKWLKKWGIEVFYGKGMPSVLGWYSDADEYRLDGELADAPEWLIEMLTPPPPKPRKGKATPSADGHIDADSLLRERDHYAELEPRLAGLEWEVKERGGESPILIAHCPDHEGDDKDLHIAIGPDGPHIQCKHATCTLIPPLNGRANGSAAPVEEVSIPVRDGDAADVEAGPAPAPRTSAGGPVVVEVVHEDWGDDDQLSRFPLTELGNAERLVARFGHSIRYAHAWDKWLVWDGMRWAVDETAEAVRLAKRMVRKIIVEASLIDDKNRRDAVLGWARASEKRAVINATMALASSEKRIPIVPDEMDRDGWLFNVANGTIDLRTGTLRPHCRGDLLTQLCPLEFDPSADCPLWLNTLDLFFKGDRGLIDYWQRLCGYCLTGVVRDHIMPIAYGKGSNGKSTILGTLIGVFGPDYAMKCPPDMLMSKQNPSHPTDLTDLFRKRLVAAIESEQGRRLNETLVKELTGGDSIRARRMREDFWEFDPTHTLIMATNHKPLIRGSDNGIWRRLKLVPFSVTVEGKKAKTDVAERLVSEYPGILAWCLRGCLEWQRQGLDEPRDVESATKHYKADQDRLGAFLEEHVEHHPGSKTKGGLLYGRYKVWAEQSGEYLMSQTEFGTQMEERGYERKRSGGIQYLDIRLRPIAG